MYVTNNNQYTYNVIIIEIYIKYTKIGKRSYMVINNERIQEPTILFS